MGSHPEELLRALAALPRHHPSRRTVREQAIEAWLPLAAHVARRFAGRGEPVRDLTQTAAIGLINAVDRFDPARGTAFAAYAVPTILGELRRHFRDHAWAVHVPRHLQELWLAVAGCTEQLTQQLGRRPGVAELAVALQLPESEIREGLRVAGAYTTASLDAPLPGATGGAAPPLRELLGQEDDALVLVELRVAAAPAVAMLSERDRRVLYLRFVANLTQEQIAERVGVSQMHVSRLLSRVLARLRAAVRDRAGERSVRSRCA